MSQMSIIIQREEVKDIKDLNLHIARYNLDVEEHNEFR